MSEKYQSILNSKLKYENNSVKFFSNDEKIERDNFLSFLMDEKLKIRKSIDTYSFDVKSNLGIFFNKNGNIDDDSVKDLENLALSLSNYKEQLDAGLSYEIRSIITDYAKKVDDIELYIRNIFYNALNLYFIDGEHFSNKRVNLYNDILKYKNRYEEFSEEIRMLIVKAYANYLSATKRDDFSIYLVKYDELKDFWENVAKVKDPNFPWDIYYCNVYENLCSAFTSIYRLNHRIDLKYQIKAYAIFLNYEYLSNKLYPNKESLNNIRMQYLMQTYYFACNKISDVDYVEFLFNIVLSGDLNKYDSVNLYKNLHISAIYLYTQKICKERNNESFDIDFLKRLFSYIDNIPSDISKHLLSSHYKNINIAITKIYLPKEVISILLIMNVFRHKPTFVHSLMVAKLAINIVDRMIEKNPERFKFFNHLRDVSEIKQNKKDFLDLIWYSALLHDIGKTAYTDIVSMYARKLIDIEFEILQNHPGKFDLFFDDDLVKEFINQEYRLIHNFSNQDVLECIRDVAIGHHKSYDGTFGYPKTFNNVDSPFKLLIDIVTICDSIDAATDSIGRGYSVEKDFDLILNEITSNKNTRYSGYVIDFINNDIDLRIKLKDIIQKTRYDIYYMAIFDNDIQNIKNYIEDIKL